jgi:hypothetical protein
VESRVRLHGHDRNPAPTKAALVRSAERGCQQASRVALTKFCGCNNSCGDDFAHQLRLAGVLKFFKGGV